MPHRPERGEEDVFDVFLNNTIICFTCVSIIFIIYYFLWMSMPLTLDKQIDIRYSSIEILQVSIKHFSYSIFLPINHNLLLDSLS